MIDLRASSAELQRLWNISIEQWSFFTQEEPYWSVLSSPDWRSDQLNPSKLDRFYKTGKSCVDSFVEACNRHNIVPSGTCLELGSGVGRVTSHLATVFDKIVATDISEKNLSICNSYCKDLEIDIRVLHNYNDIQSLKSYNCWA
jgi:2-polyprenyl-3-methyl-5-hydroxy-6-metoxy-1,4-benzoquinol methylase